MAGSSKKNKGQFYTTNARYILDGLLHPPTDARCIIEPFTGKGDLIEWIRGTDTTLPIEMYDIDPKIDGTIQRDTLKSPPNYKHSWIITNPPYLARNKCSSKDLFDQYNTNDLYKCFITCLSVEPYCRGGIMIVPAGFFFSSRDIDVRCRHNFMKQYKIHKVRYFEETVFVDTTTTVVAFSFEKSEIELDEQFIEWTILPSGISKLFHMNSTYDWIIGGDIYNLEIPANIKVRRHVEGNLLKPGEQQTFMTLNALDSGTLDGRIALTYKNDYVYPAKECSRTYATLRIAGRHLSEDEQKTICNEFNKFIEEKRSEYWSLFLPQFRESKEYARKRIPFELAYKIVMHIISIHLP